MSSLSVTLTESRALGLHIENELLAKSAGGFEV